MKPLTTGAVISKLLDLGLSLAGWGLTAIATKVIYDSVGAETKEDFIKLIDSKLN